MLNVSNVNFEVAYKYKFRNACISMAILIATETLVFLGFVRQIILYQSWGHIWIIIGNYPKVFKKLAILTQSVVFMRQ